MKLVKSLLLGSAAGLVAVAGASAADLGVKKPTAVEYVKTCPQYGAGFFVVPGTTSCLKIIGRVRADYIFNNDLTLKWVLKPDNRLHAIANIRSVPPPAVVPRLLLANHLIGT